MHTMQKEKANTITLKSAFSTSKEGWVESLALGEGSFLIWGMLSWEVAGLASKQPVFVVCRDCGQDSHDIEVTSWDIT